MIRSEYFNNLSETIGWLQRKEITNIQQQNIEKFLNQALDDKQFGDEGK